MVREPYARWCGRVRLRSLTLPDPAELVRALADAWRQGSQIVETRREYGKRVRWFKRNSSK